MTHAEFRARAQAVLASTDQINLPFPVAHLTKQVDRDRCAIAAWLDGCPISADRVRKAVAMVEVAAAAASG